MERDNSFTARSLITYYRTRLLCPNGLEPNGHGVQPVVSVKDGIATLKCRCERGENLPLKPERISVEQLASRSDKAASLFPVVAPVRDWRLELAAV